MLTSLFTRAAFQLFALILCGLAVLAVGIAPVAAQGNAGLALIAGNMSKFPNARYFCCSAKPIIGSASGGPFYYGVPFTPSANATIKRIAVPVFYNNSTGLHTIDVSLNNDSSGLPGAAIQTWKLQNLPRAGAGCCVLDVAYTQQGIQVTAGTQYWIVVAPDANSPDFVGQWFLNTTDMRLSPYAFFNGSWNLSTNIGLAYLVSAN
jgi:hypothetical protein